MRPATTAFAYLLSLLLLAFSTGCNGGSGSPSSSDNGSGKGTYLMWDAPQKDADDNQYPQPNDVITGYTIYFGTSTSIYSAGNYTVPASVTSVRVEDALQLLKLAPNKFYCVVTALDKYGNESGFSNEVEADMR